MCQLIVGLAERTQEYEEDEDGNIHRICLLIFQCFSCSLAYEAWNGTRGADGKWRYGMELCSNEWTCRCCLVCPSNRKRAVVFITLMGGTSVDRQGDGKVCNNSQTDEGKRRPWLTKNR
jgi:hypothetical protein